MNSFDLSDLILSSDLSKKIYLKHSHLLNEKNEFEDFVKEA